MKEFIIAALACLLWICFVNYYFLFRDKNPSLSERITILETKIYFLEKQQWFSQKDRYL